MKSPRRRKRSEQSAPQKRYQIPTIQVIMHLNVSLFIIMFFFVCFFYQATEKKKKKKKKVKEEKGE